MGDYEVDEDELRRYYGEMRYRNELMNHPDCNDPDHPGCKGCEEDEEGEDDNV